MKVAYDVETDSLVVVFRDGHRVVESDEDTSGAILDYDADGGLVSVEILSASKKVTDPTHVDFTQHD